MNLGSPHQFVTGLMAAWAEVCDILTFYQEHIAREGYLQSALEARSVRWLAAQIGYRPNPAISAQVPVSFRFGGSRAKRGPGQLIPRRSVLQSVPRSGGLPVLFETVADLEAIPDADSIPVSQPSGTFKAVLTPGATALRIDNRARVREGQMLLIMGSADDPAVAGQLWSFGAITAVDSDPIQSCKIVRWNQRILGPLATLPSAYIEAYVLESQSRLFGFRARPWSVVPESVKINVGSRSGGVMLSPDLGANWTPANQGLPPGIWQAIAGLNNILLAGGTNGIYRSSDAGATWEFSALRGRTVFAIARTPSGDFIVGTTNGGLYRSADRGHTWDAMSGVLLGEQRALVFRRKVEQRALVFRKKVKQIPPVNIRSLLVIPAGDSLSIYAGTDAGLFRMKDGANWLPASKGLPGWQEDSGTAQTAIYSLVADPRDQRLYAGTSHGMYVSTNHGESWDSLGPRLSPRESFFNRLIHAAAQPRPPQVVAAAAVYDSVARQTVLLAATPEGILRTTDNGRNWQTVFASESHALTPVVDGGTTVVLAGTETGIYRSTDHGQTWLPSAVSALRFQVPGDPSTPLTFGPLDRNWLAAFRKNGIRLSPETQIEASPDTEGIVVDPRSGQHYSISAGVGAWMVTLNVPVAIRAIEFSDKHLLAAGLVGNILENDWPNPELEAGHVDLDSTEPTPVAESWAVVSERDLSGSPPPLAVPFRILSSNSAVRTGFGFSRTVTRLQPSGVVDLSTFDPRKAHVDLHSRKVPLFELSIKKLEVIEGQSIRVTGDFSAWKGGRTVVVTGARPRAFVEAPLGGVLVFVSPNDTRRIWPDQSVSALAVNAEGTIAAAIGGLVFLVTLSDTTSPPRSFGVPDSDVASLLWIGSVLWATGRQGIWKRGPDDAAWSDGGLSDRQVFAIVAGRSGQVFAGTDDGVYVNEAGSWTSSGLNGKAVKLLAVDSEGALVAGLVDVGVFISEGAGNWQPIATEAEYLRPSALTTGPSRTVTIASMGGGVFRRTAGSDQLMRIDGNLPLVTIAALATDLAGVTYAALPGWGLASEQHANWTRMPVGVANACTALASLPSGGVAAATGLAMVSLNRHTAIISRTPTGSIPVALASDLNAQFYSKALKDALNAAGIQLKTVLEIRVMEEENRWRIISGSAESWYLRSQASSIVIFRDDPLHLMRQTSADGEWTTDAGTVFANTGELSVYFAEQDASAISEAVTISRPPTLTMDANGAVVTTLQFTTPLKNVYDAATLRVAGNTVVAQEGETVYQVLGSGDSGKRHQSFVLHRRPVSVTAGQGSDGLAPRISVFITPDMGRVVHPRANFLQPRGPAIEWQRFDSLLAAGPNEPAYTLETDTSGILSIVHFGDGVHGARLPTGRENVSAEYVVGAGESGNVGPGEISILRSGPPGQMRVTNLVAAEGGTASEPADRIRQRAPLSLQTLNRVVSLHDYAAYAAVFPGVEQSSGALLQMGDGLALAVTISGVRNDVPAPGLLNDLKLAIEAARATAEPFDVLPYQPAPFHLHVRVTPDGSVDPARVVKSIQQTISSRFGLGAAEFRKDVAASEIVALTEDTPGVSNAVVDALYRIPGPVLREPLLRARRAHWNVAKKQPVPDELVYLDLPDGLHISLETSR